MRKPKRLLPRSQATIREILGRDPDGPAPLARTVLANGVVLVGRETERPKKKRRRR